RDPDRRLGRRSWSPRRIPTEAPRNRRAVMREPRSSQWNWFGAAGSLVLPPRFCLFGQPVEIGHALEQLVERIGHKLLRGAPVHSACEPQLEMTIGIEAERERRLCFAAGRRASAHRAARRNRRGSLVNRRKLSLHRRRHGLGLRLTDFGFGFGL